MTISDTIARGIRAGKLLDQSTFTGADIPGILVGRDADAFEQEWLRVFDLQRHAEFSPQQARSIERVRELAYKATYAFTQHPEIAGYVCDDFELIAKGSEMGIGQ